MPRVSDPSQIKPGLKMYSDDEPEQRCIVTVIRRFHDYQFIAKIECGEDTWQEFFHIRDWIGAEIAEGSAS